MNKNRFVSRLEKISSDLEELLDEVEDDDPIYWSLEDIVVDIDAQKSDETIKDQLFVVCELPKEKCDPIHSPKAQVANFGWSKVEDEWELEGIVLFKLIHSQ